MKPKASPGTPVGAARRGRPRAVLIGMVLLFVVPIVGAYVLNAFFPGWQPFGTSNRGQLLSPVLTLEPGELRSIADGHAEAGIEKMWVLTYVEPAPCGPRCESRLIELRQVHLALGRRADKVVRAWFVPTTTVPAVRVQAVRAKFPELRLLEVTEPLMVRLRRRIAAEPHVLIVDPAGNVVLHYQSGQSGSDMLKDLQRLLRISKLPTRNDP